MRCLPVISVALRDEFTAAVGTGFLASTVVVGGLDRCRVVLGLAHHVGSGEKGDVAGFQDFLPQRGGKSGCGKMDTHTNGFSQILEVSTQ